MLTINISKTMCRKLNWILLGCIFIIFVAFVTSCGGNTDKSKQETAEVETQLWTCEMHPEVIQEEPGNCPICDMKLTPVKDEAVVWTCKMHPDVVQEEPGNCPICEMKLTPVRKGNMPAHFSEHDHDMQGHDNMNKDSDSTEE